MIKLVSRSSERLRGFNPTYSDEEIIKMTESLEKGDVVILKFRFNEHIVISGDFRVTKKNDNNSWEAELIKLNPKRNLDNLLARGFQLKQIFKIENIFGTDKEKDYPVGSER